MMEKMFGFAVVTFYERAHTAYTAPNNQSCKNQNTDDGNQTAVNRAIGAIHKLNFMVARRGGNGKQGIDPRCGDGNVDSDHGEMCDDGARNGTGESQCSAGCTSSGFQ